MFENDSPLDVSLCCYFTYIGKNLPKQHATNYINLTSSWNHLRQLM